MKIKYKGSLPRGTVDWRGGSYNFVKGETNEWPDELVKELVGVAGDSWEVSEEPQDKPKTKKGGRPWQ